jgi:AraC family transcriptional regulator
MQPTIKSIPSKKLIGLHMQMSLVNNKTADLWKSFMPRRKEIETLFRNQLFSLQVYDVDYFQAFNPQKEFAKWALMEVESFDDIPDGMSTFVLPEGMYAVFHYKGLNTDTSIFQYIFGEWLPQSAYVLDNRPHFELLGEKYKNADPDSEEEIWIPIKLK